MTAGKRTKRTVIIATARRSTNTFVLRLFLMFSLCMHFARKKVVFIKLVKLRCSKSFLAHRYDPKSIMFSSSFVPFAAHLEGRSCAFLSRLIGSSWTESRSSFGSFFRGGRGRNLNGRFLSSLPPMHSRLGRFLRPQPTKFDARTQKYTTHVPSFPLLSSSAHSTGKDQARLKKIPLFLPLFQILCLRRLRSPDRRTEQGKMENGDFLLPLIPRAPPPPFSLSRDALHE